MRRKKALWILWVIFLTGPACLLGSAPTGGQPIVPETGLESTPLPPSLLTSIPPTEVPRLLVTPTPQPTEAPAPSPTPPPPTPTTVQGPVDAVVTAGVLNLRAGPGTFFDALGQARQGTRVQVLGRARGANWVYIDTGAIQGWAAAAYTSLDNTDVLAALEPIETAGMQMIYGRVRDRAGQPVPGVVFGLFQGREDSNPPTARAETDAQGSFYFYLPANFGGTWRISLTGAGCDSPAVNNRCQITGALMPRFTDVTLPVEETVEFLYEE